MLKSGDRLRVMRPFHTMAGVAYGPDDILELVEPTGQAPFGHESKLCNWVVKCKHWTPPDRRATWSGIWAMVDQGWIEKIDDV